MPSFAFCFMTQLPAEVQEEAEQCRANKSPMIIDATWSWSREFNARHIGWEWRKKARGGEVRGDGKGAGREKFGRNFLNSARAIGTEWDFCVWSSARRSHLISSFVVCISLFEPSVANITCVMERDREGATQTGAH